jgi:hypothetical protein
MTMGTLDVSFLALATLIGWFSMVRQRVHEDLRKTRDNTALALFSPKGADQ